VVSAYALDEASGAYGFDLGAYDSTKPLVIDPVVVVYGGYIGGAESEYGEGIAVDGAGNAYVTGTTDSRANSFPVKVGPDLTYNRSVDAFVAKVDASGEALVYAGYVGGGGVDVGQGVAVDDAGNAYVAGTTDSREGSFPVKVGPDLTQNRSDDAFVAKVSPSGESLVYAGYIGGAGEDSATNIAVDGAGNAYVTGGTTSGEEGFPVKVGPDLTFNGGVDGDAFVAKVEASGEALVYAGYIGGAIYDNGYGVATDEAGNAYVTGITSSPGSSFPVKVGPDLTHNGDSDGFVAKVEASGEALVYAGYIGGAQGDYGGSVAVDGAGNAYVVGGTGSLEDTFPVKVGPDLTYNGSFWDAFVAKVKVSGRRLVYAGYIGGADSDIGRDVAVDGAGNAYVGGDTGSREQSFPVKVGPDLTFNGFHDAFIAKVHAAGEILIYAGYIGGAHHDLGGVVAVDEAGNAYVTGRTDSSADSFPVKVGPDLSYNGADDAFVVKISSE
jgi:hypothetical protein